MKQTIRSPYLSSDQIEQFISCQNLLKGDYYNDFCEEGRVDEFGKDPAYLWSDCRGECGKICQSAA
jgi:hypothetical protein